MIRGKISQPTIAIIASAFLVAGALVLYVIGIGIKHQSPVSPRAQPPYQLEHYSFRFERTACFGPCPIFTLKIEGDGVATLDIHDDTRVMSGRIDESTFHELVNTLEQGDFRDLSHDYSAQVTDLPSTIVSIDSPFGSHTVSVYGVPCVSEVKSERILADYQDSDGGYVPDVFCALVKQLDRVTCSIYEAHTEPAERTRADDRFWNPSPNCEARDE